LLWGNFFRTRTERRQPSFTGYPGGGAPFTRGNDREILETNSE
jgi:hypothetical protein